MHFYSKAFLKKWSVVVVVPWVAACGSVAPGLHFDQPSNYQASGSSAQSSSDNDAANAVLKPITPQLVKDERVAREKQVSQDISKLLGKPTSYKIDTGDVLSIVVWDHPELTNAATGVAGPGVSSADVAATMQPPAGFPVDHEGTIQFPYAGSLKVAGLTEEQARNLLTNKLARYIRQPKVTLRVQAYRSKRVYVDGEVKNPGDQRYPDDADRSDQPRRRCAADRRPKPGGRQSWRHELPYQSAATGAAWRQPDQYPAGRWRRRPRPVAR
jgi:polysaccharide export outer membrane protein